LFWSWGFKCSHALPERPRNLARDSLFRPHFERFKSAPCVYAMFEFSITSHRLRSGRKTPLLLPRSAMCCGLHLSLALSAWVVPVNKDGGRWSLRSNGGGRQPSEPPSGLWHAAQCGEHVPRGDLILKKVESKLGRIGEHDYGHYLTMFQSYPVFW